MAERKSKRGARTSSTARASKDGGSPRKAKASISNWDSVGSSQARRYLYMPPAQDLRRDLTPYDRLTMVRKCRWAERNSGLFRQILNDLVLYSVGDGITPQSHAQDEQKAKLYEEYFAKAARRVDVTGRFSFWQAQAIMLRAMARDGDAFAAKVRNGRGEAKLQLMEAHRVGDPVGVEPPARMHDGVQFGAYGEIVGFNIYRSDGSSRFMPSPSVMHIVDQEYASGARGVPMMQHSVSTVQDEMELLQLELRATKDAADITRVIKKEGGFLDEETAGEIAGSGSCDLHAAAAAFGGKLLTLAPGESMESFQSNRPNATFQGFLEALERDIAQGVLPYEFVGDSSKIGGASVRLVAAKAARVFSKYSQVIIDALCIPTWGFIVGDAIARGELPDDPDWARTSWTTPKSVTVDAGRDAANDRNDLELGVTNFTELFAQRGLDFRTEMKRRADDMNFIINTAKAAGIPVWMLYKPGFNWLQQGQANSQIPEQTAENLDIPPPPEPEQPNS